MSNIMNPNSSESGESVIQSRIYLWERKPEIRVALPLVSPPLKEYAPSSVARAMESKPAPIVLAVYRYGGEANDVKDYYYYDFIGMEVC